jgi:hypothetical protein
VPELHRRHHSPHAAAAIAPPSTWQQFGSHRMRAPIGIVIDTPFPIVGGWVAAIWPDATDPAGWRRLLWQRDEPTGRGWLVPERLAFADVVEFGSDPAGTRRWYGLVEQYEPGQWLGLRGPFANPADAERAAEQLLDPQLLTANPKKLHHRRATGCSRPWPTRRP